jgi:hypothetical protein
MKHTYLNDYTHSHPIIFSHINGQYQGKISEFETDSYILYTTVDFHFVFGQVPSNHETFLSEIKRYIKHHQKEEFILFFPNQKWKTCLQEAMKTLNAVIDQRVLLLLDDNRFNDIYNNHTFKHEVVIDDEINDASSIPFPCAKVQDKGYAKGFMIGNQAVEIDVYTKEMYRHQNIAFETSLNLIQHILEKNLTPNWSCWKQKKSSIHLAKKLGFKEVTDIDAFIWIKAFTENE